MADVAIHHPDLIHGDRAWADGIVRLHSKIDALTTSKPERATEFMRLIDAIDERDGGGFMRRGSIVRVYDQALQYLKRILIIRIFQNLRLRLSQRVMR